MKADRQLVRRLHRHVQYLAASARRPGSIQHRRARNYVSSFFDNCLYTVYQVPFKHCGYEGINILTEPIPRNRPELPLLIVGAHYDTVHTSPGADDNASAVAVMLELSRGLLELLSQPEHFCSRRIQFAAYDLEEYQSVGVHDCNGSAAHCKELQKNGTDVAAMFSLEMLGYTDVREGSQKFPSEVASLYPKNLPGDFIAIVGNERSKELASLMHQSFEEATDLRCDIPPLIVAGNGESVPDTRRSDHKAFWDAGIPALMVTDTAELRNPHYHKPTDTPETLDYTFMAKVKMGIQRTLIHLLFNPSAHA